MGLEEIVDVCVMLYVDHPIVQKTAEDIRRHYKIDVEKHTEEFIELLEVLVKRKSKDHTVKDKEIALEIADYIITMFQLIWKGGVSEYGGSSPRMNTCIFQEHFALISFMLDDTLDHALSTHKLIELIGEAFSEKMNRIHARMNTPVWGGEEVHQVLVAANALTNILSEKLKEDKVHNHIKQTQEGGCCTVKPVACSPTYTKQDLATDFKPKAKINILISFWKFVTGKLTKRV